MKIILVLVFLSAKTSMVGIAEFASWEDCRDSVVATQEASGGQMHVNATALICVEHGKFLRKVR